MNAAQNNNYYYFEQEDYPACYPAPAPQLSAADDWLKNICWFLAGLYSGLYPLFIIIALILLF